MGGYLVRRADTITSSDLAMTQGTSGSGKSTLGESLAAALRVPFIDGDDLHPAANVAKMSAGHPLDDSDREPWLRKIRKTAEEVLMGSGIVEVTKPQEEVQSGQQQGDVRGDGSKQAFGFEGSDQQKRLAEVFETSGHQPHPQHKERVAEAIKQGAHDGAPVDPLSRQVTETSVEDTAATQTVKVSTSVRPTAIVIACSALKLCYRDLLRGDHSSFSPDSPPMPPSALRTVHLYVDVSAEELLRRMHQRKGHFMKEEMLKSQLATLEKPKMGQERNVLVVEDGKKEEVEQRAEREVKKLLAMADNAA